MTRPLRLVTPAPAPVEIYAELRAEIRKRDWGSVHLAGDRNPPLSFVTRPWRWSNPRPRKEKP